MHSPAGVDLWWARTGDDEERLSQRAVAASRFGAQDRARMTSFSDPRAEATFVLAGLLLRYAVGQVVNEPWTAVVVDRHCATCGGDHGKPRVGGGIEVSVAHSADVVAVAVTTLGEVGIDLEMPSGTDVRPIAALALAQGELDALTLLPTSRQAAAVLRWWTRKEAVLKMTGEGLAADPRDLVVTAPDQSARVLSWKGHEHLVGQIALHDVELGDSGAIANLAVHTSAEVRSQVHEASTALVNALALAERAAR